ncbi:hypothetical protein P7C70_g186, partial [Phenoliferia sp. Uapishka_3]
METLLALGIPKQRANFALLEFNGDVEAACDWCFEEGKDWTPADLLGTRPPPRAAADSPPPPPSHFNSAAPSGYPSSNDNPTNHGRPPPHRAITPMTKVKIILKTDQPTGRTVEGEVKEVLTRGDHPRGVKVRLVDGRVGRVVGLL